MPIVTALRRARQLRPREGVRLAEAFAALSFASAAVSALPFRRVTRLASRSRRLRTEDPAKETQTAAAVRRAVEAWARRVPWKAVCFQIGLAVHLMLRRRGIPSILHYGVGRKEEDDLAAHVWVTLRGEIVVGEYEAANFACVATFPPDEPAPKRGKGNSSTITAESDCQGSGQASKTSQQ